MEVVFVGTHVPHFGIGMCWIFWPKCGVGLYLLWAFMYLEFVGDEDVDKFGMDSFV